MSAVDICDRAWRRAKTRRRRFAAVLRARAECALLKLSDYQQLVRVDHARVVVASELGGRVHLYFWTGHRVAFRDFKQFVDVATAYYYQRQSGNDD